MKILITGANGLIGRQLAHTLQRDGHQLVCCARQPNQLRPLLPAAEVHPIDFNASMKPAQWLPYLQEVEVVINCVGIFRESPHSTFEHIHHTSAMVLFQACEQSGVRRVIQISALGADEQANSRYHQSKYRADQYLRSTHLDWAIVAPSLVYGPGSPSLRLFRQLASLPLIPVPDRGDQLLQPISLEDAVMAIQFLVITPNAIRAHIPLVGPTALSLKELITTQRHWLGLPSSRFIDLPSRPLVRLLGWLEPLHTSVATSDSLRMLKRGNTAPANDFLQRFGWQAQEMTTVMTLHPASPAERWFYTLNGLRYLLLVSLAALWIFTGWVSLFIYPQDSSLALLQSVGVPDGLQRFSLYGAALIDTLLGIALLIPRLMRTALKAQICLMALYSLILLIQLPEYWLHPFGPVSKNIPLMVATLMLLVMSQEER